jgi:MFS family permease
MKTAVSAAGTALAFDQRATTQTEQPGRAGSGLARYREVLATPGALAFAIPGVVGRMPIAMLSLALVILLAAVTGSYGIAGAVSATAALAYAVMTPVAARLADRYGQARVLRPQVLVFAAATAALALCATDRAPVWALAVTAGLSRATMPSLGPMVRSRWSQLLASTALLDTAFSLEGIADELIFITGPVLAVALAAGFTPVAGVLVTAALSVAGVAGLTGQRRTEPPAAPVTRTHGPALRSPALRVLIAMTVCLGAVFVAVDLATIAFAARHGDKAAAGPLLGLYGLGSAIAGVVVRGPVLAVVPRLPADRRAGRHGAGRRAAGVHARHLAEGRRHHRGRAGHLRHLGQFLPGRRDGRPGRAAHRGHVVADHRRSDRHCPGRAPGRPPDRPPRRTRRIPVRLRRRTGRRGDHAPAPPGASFPPCTCHANCGARGNIERTLR